MDQELHIAHMKQALMEARKAYEEGEIPIGAVVAVGSRIISRGHNQVERLSDPTAHAEIIALTSAFNFLGSKYLPDATLYVTIEPCLMCAGASYWSKLGGVVYGAPDGKNGYGRVCGGNIPFHPKTIVQNGILAEECALLMKSFFQGKR